MLRDVDGIPIVEIVGDIDLFNVEPLEDALRTAAAKDVGAVIISFADATYFDSAVIYRVLKFRRQLAVNRQTLFIVVPRIDAAQRLLQIVGLTGRNDRCNSLDEALALAAERRHDGIASSVSSDTSA